MSGARLLGHATEIPQYVKRPPLDGDAVLACCERAPTRPVTLLTLNPDDRGYWYEFTPPATVTDPKGGNLEARWLAVCGGCSRAHGHDPRAVPIRRHFLFGSDERDAAADGAAFGVSVPPGAAALS